jgi:regulator of sigma E protease
MLANVVTDILTGFIWPLAQFLIGLGVVVFFHELGHFLAARWAGIKVERFAIGMGPRLWGVVKGETDYCLCAIPLGGYVKMLGQEDFKPVEGEDGIDPRSFLAKSVGKRMVVISAGVVMNVILAAILFIIVGMVGKKDNAPIIGDVAPALPAARAQITWEPLTDANDTPLTPPVSDVGLEPGDRIVSINGKPVKHFGDIQTAGLLANKGEAFDFVIQRDVQGVTWTGKTRIQVQFSQAQGVNIFGVNPAMSLTVIRNPDQFQDIPFQDGDAIEAMDGKSVKLQWQLAPIAKALGGKDALAAVRRKDGSEVQVTVAPTVRTRGDVWYTPDGKRVVGWSVEPPEDADDETKTKTAWLQAPDGSTLELPLGDLVGGAALILDVMGMTPRFRVNGVEKGGVIFHTPAYKAGLQPGDIILSYADRPTPNFRQFTDICEEIGKEPTTIVVLRGGETKTFSITPAKQKKRIKIGIAPGLDLAHPIVGSVRDNSPAAKIGIEKGAEITAINNQKIHSWQDMIATLKKLAGREVVLQGRVGATEKTWNLGLLDEAKFHPDDYEWALLEEVPFESESIKVVYRNPLKAVAWGVGEAGRWTVLIYKSFGAILRGSVSPGKAVQGPVGIGAIAISAAREDFMNLVRLMALLSVALAVFNFLPIPVLDGGHALLLIIEKIRGKALPLKFVNALQMVFLVLILGLFVLIMWNDFVNLLQGLFL